jgi:plastocyanin
MFVAARVDAANQDVTWDFTVTPPSVTIKVGDTVTWNGELSFHPLAVSNATFSTVGTVLANSGTSFVRTFSAPGTFYFICANHSSMRTTVVVCNPPTQPAVLDIDGNGEVTGSTDGLLVVRYLLGLRGAALVEGAVGNCPGRNTAGIESYLASAVVP